MTTRSRSAEQERLKKARQRQRRAEAAKLKIEAEATRIEEEAKHRERVAERAAPAIMRDQVKSEHGYVLRGVQIEVVNGKPARVDPIAALKLTGRQRQAGRQIQADWREVASGINVGAVDYLRSGSGGGDGTGAHFGIFNQILIRRRLDGAITFLGAFAPLVARVVLDCIPAHQWAYQEGRPVEDASRWVAAALDRLALYYWPPQIVVGMSGGRTKRILSFGPPREDYDLDVAIEGA